MNKPNLLKSCLKVTYTSDFCIICIHFYEICFKSCLVLFCSLFFKPFSFAITSLGEERTNLSAFCTFVRFALAWFCLFPLPLGVWEGLRLVIVALPGISSYFFYHGKKLK